MTSQKQARETKTLLIAYHSQGGNVKRMAEHIAKGAALEENITVTLKSASEVTSDDLLTCNAIALGSPEYFGTMAGMVKDLFDRTYEDVKEKTISLPYVLFVCAGNDGRGAIAQMERIITGYKWKKVQEHIRLTGSIDKEDLEKLEELGHTLAAGLDFGIF